MSYLPLYNARPAGTAAALQISTHAGQASGKLHIAVVQNSFLRLL